MKIKQYFNVVDLPTSIDYEMPSGARLAAGKEALGGVGKALMQGANAISDFVAEKSRIDNELDYASRVSEFRSKTKDVEIDLEKDPNEATHVPRLMAAIGDIQGDILGKTKNKQVKDALTKTFLQEGTTHLNAGKEFAFKTYLAKTGGKYSQTLFDMAQQYITSDESSRALISGEAETLIKATAVSLGRDPDADLRAWKKDATIGAIKADALVDPTLTKKRVQAGYYKGIAEEEKPAILRMTDILIKEQEALLHQARVDTVGQELMNTYSSHDGIHKDFDTMFKVLDSTSFLKQNNLTMQDANDIGILLGAQRQRYEAGRTQTYHKTDQEAFVRFQQGTLNPSQLGAWVSKDKMSGEQGRTWTNFLDAWIKTGKEIKTDDNTFIQRFNEIKASGGDDTLLNAVRNWLVQDAKNKLLNREAYVQLWNMTDKESEAVFQDDYFKMTDKYFKQQLGFQLKIGALGELMDVPPTPEASQAYVQANLELIKAYKTEKNLRGPDLFQRGVRILVGKKLGMKELMGGIETKKPLKPSSPTVMQEAPPHVKSALPDAGAYFKQSGTIPLRDKQTKKVYKTDGKTWWELKE